MKLLLAWIRKITGHPYVNIAMGLVLMVTSIVEVGVTLWRDLAALDIRAPHGLGLFGLFYALKSLPQAFEGYARLLETGKE